VAGTGRKWSRIPRSAGELAPIRSMLNACAQYACCIKTPDLPDRSFSTRPSELIIPPRRRNHHQMQKGLHQAQPIPAQFGLIHGVVLPIPRQAAITSTSAQLAPSRRCPAATCAVKNSRASAARMVLLLRLVAAGACQPLRPERPPQPTLLLCTAAQFLDGSKAGPRAVQQQPPDPTEPRELAFNQPSKRV